MRKANKKGILVSEKYPCLRIEEFYRAVIQFKGQFTLKEIIKVYENLKEEI